MIEVAWVSQSESPASSPQCAEPRYFYTQTFGSPRPHDCIQLSGDPINEIWDTHFEFKSWLQCFCTLPQLIFFQETAYEPRYDKTNKMSVRPAKTRISLGIRPVWSESLLSAWRNLGSLATHWVHSKDTDQTWQMPRLIWVFAGRTLILLVLSCRGSYLFSDRQTSD